jgi:hypothetical protein
VLEAATAHEVQEAYAAAAPVVLPEATGQTDVLTPTFPAWAREGRAAESLDRCLSVLAVSASQALWLAGREPAPPLRPFLTRVRERFAPVESLRDLGVECEALARGFGADVLRDIFPPGERSP